MRRRRRLASRGPLNRHYAETPDPRRLADQLLSAGDSEGTLTEAIVHTLNDSELPTDIIGIWLDSKGIADEEFELAYAVMDNVTARIKRALEPSRR